MKPMKLLIRLLPLPMILGLLMTFAGCEAGVYYPYPSPDYPPGYYGPYGTYWYGYRRYHRFDHYHHFEGHPHFEGLPPPRVESHGPPPGAPHGGYPHSPHPFGGPGGVGPRQP